MREYRVWCRICAVEFLLPERYSVDEGMGVRIPCPKCGDWNQYEYREIKLVEHGRPA
jgi:hypothetical protein